MLPIELVVFDLAGTTVYDDGSIVKAFQKAMKGYGYLIPELDINHLMGYHKPLAIHMMLNKYEPDRKKINDTIISEIHQYFQQEMVLYYSTVDTLAPLPFAEEVFAELQANGIKVGFNTGFSKEIANTIIERLGWLQNGLGNFLVASDEVPEGRPKPFMIQQMMEAARITDPRKVIKVGDTEVDIMEGRNAGCLYSIAVTTGAFSFEELLPYEPDFILRGLDELVPLLK
jgi:phosphonatase-like hydrolase